MSVRAYKLIDIKTEDTETFNLWHNTSLMDCLQENQEQLNMDGSGLMDVSEIQAKSALEHLEDSLKELIADNHYLPEDERHRELQDSIEAAKALIKACQPDGYAQFYCY